MFPIRHALLKRGIRSFQVIQKLYSPGNVDNKYTCGILHQEPKRYCSSELKIPPLSAENEEDKCKRQILGSLEGKMKLIFTCKKCRTRNTKFFSKLGYEKGVVIVRCDGCKNNHLIADNLGWFSNSNKKTNIEYILKHKGESICRVERDDIKGYIEIIAKEALSNVERSEQLGDSSVEETSTRVG